MLSLGGNVCCLLRLRAGAGGEVSGGEVGEGGIGLAVCCACILWGKGGAVSVGACMLSLGGGMYAVCCDSLLELVGR